jgi:hypothetical protein
MQSIVFAPKADHIKLTKTLEFAHDSVSNDFGAYVDSVSTRESIYRG